MKTLITLTLLSLTTLTFANNSSSLITKNNKGVSNNTNEMNFKFNVVEELNVVEYNKEREDIIRRVSIDTKNSKEVMSLSNDILK